MPLPSTDATALPPFYLPATLVQMDRFHEGLASSARELLETHLNLPQEVHYVADLRRWLLSQRTIAMHFEHRLNPASPPISPGNLQQALQETRIASYNTIGTFLMELKRYNFITLLPSADKRRREFLATEKSEQLIRHYFDIHLRSLDVVDGGQRHDVSRRYPNLLQHAQPRFAARLCEQRDWHRPPESITKFVRSDSGSSVLHDLASAAPRTNLFSNPRIWIGDVSPNAFSMKYRISRMHVARLFKQARDAGFMGWAKDSNRGDCWISPVLVRDYRHWQALKLAAVSQAFHEGCQKLPISAPTEGHSPRHIANVR